jgi:BirA family biotin operon repressor/biotin-[acetyl-CoA-carboxylase] ligase
MTLGLPRVHHRQIDSTNARARELAAIGAPHGTLVTASAQSAGRGRQGRTWSAPAGHAMLMSVVLRDWPELLPLAAALAVADVAGDAATIKWPNDVLLPPPAGASPGPFGGRKVAGILVEGRPQERWMVLGIGLNVAVDVATLPAELHDRAGSLGRTPADVEPALAELLAALDGRLAEPPAKTLADYRERDALRGRAITWTGGHGVAQGVDDGGRLTVETVAGLIALDAGEVHLRPS